MGRTDQEWHIRHARQGDLARVLRLRDVVEAMVVAEAQRRRGVGRRLVERVLEDARAASCRKVQLLSHKRHAHDGAYRFYRCVGFDAEAEGFRLYLDEAQCPG